MIYILGGKPGAEIGVWERNRPFLNPEYLHVFILIKFTTI